MNKRTASVIAAVAIAASGCTVYPPGAAGPGISLPGSGTSSVPHPNPPATAPVVTSVVYEDGSSAIWHDGLKYMVGCDPSRALTPPGWDEENLAEAIATGKTVSEVDAERRADEPLGCVGPMWQLWELRRIELGLPPGSQGWGDN